MSCVAINANVKPPEAMVWAFMVIRRLWPDACGCDHEGDPWSGLQRAYTKKPFQVFENVQALSFNMLGHSMSSLHVSWEDRLVICGEQPILDRLVQLPEWQHLISAYPQHEKPEARAADPQIESEFPMGDLQLINQLALESVSAA